MRAATARRLAKVAKDKSSRMSFHQLEFDIVMKHIEFEAGRGVFFSYFDIDLISEQETIDRLERLGYSLDNVQKSPTARPKWLVSWERKAA